MWGAKPRKDFEFAKALMNQILEGAIKSEGFPDSILDQVILARYMFPYLDGKYFTITYNKM